MIDKNQKNHTFIQQKTQKREENQKNQTVRSKQSWWNTTTRWIKTQYFNSVHLIDLALNDQKSNQIWIMGQHCKSNVEARDIYSCILWFTYRNNIKFYKINQQFTINSDVGWGCMIRVGQMMLANCLRLNDVDKFADQKFIRKILNDFMKPQGKYSVQKIAEQAYKMYNLKPGDWYSPSQISYILCELQNENYSSQLKVIVYDNEFQLSKTLFYLDSKVHKKQLKNLKYNNKDKIDISSLSTDSGLIIILFRIGLAQVDEQMLKPVLKILKYDKNCIGILGGSNGKAHYIVGTTLDNFIYLDPHCVKETEQLDSFFCTNLFSIPHKNIDPCMGICFHVRNKTQLILLFQRFQKDKLKLPFYSYTNVSPPLIFQEETTSKFQLLQMDQDQIY